MEHQETKVYMEMRSHLLVATAARAGGQGTAARKRCKGRKDKGHWSGFLNSMGGIFSCFTVNCRTLCGVQSIIHQDHHRAFSGQNWSQIPWCPKQQTTLFRENWKVSGVNPSRYDLEPEHSHSATRASQTLFLWKACIPCDWCLCCCLSHQKFTNNLISKNDHPPQATQKDVSREIHYGYKFLNIFTAAVVPLCTGNLPKCSSLGNKVPWLSGIRLAQLE